MKNSQPAPTEKKLFTITCDECFEPLFATPNVDEQHDPHLCCECDS